MITNKGRDVVAKYLAGQVTSCFSHLAIGVGAQPQPLTDIIDQDSSAWVGTEVLLDGQWGLETDTGLVKLGDGTTDWDGLVYQAEGIKYEPDSILTQKSLVFEALRVPISSTTVINEGGDLKLLFSGEVPSTSRYEVSEIGLFSAAFNSLLTSSDDRLIFSFSDSEAWSVNVSDTNQTIEYVSSMSSDQLSIDAIPNTVTTGYPFFVSVDNEVFVAEDRKRQQPRLLNDVLMVRGDLSTISGAEKAFTVSGDYVSKTAFAIDLNKARPSDEIKLAFSILNTDYADLLQGFVADAVRIQVVFKTNDVNVNATLDVLLTHSATNVQATPSTIDFETDGYYVVTKPMSDVVQSIGFTWDKVVAAAIYVAIDPNVNLTADKYYVALDGLRFDSTNDNNPTYGLTAYSIVHNDDATTETKAANTEGIIEYKLTIEAVQ